MGRISLQPAVSSIIEEKIVPVWHGQVTWLVTSYHTVLSIPDSSNMVTTNAKKKIMFCHHIYLAM